MHQNIKRKKLIKRKYGFKKYLVFFKLYLLIFFCYLNIMKFIISSGVLLNFWKKKKVYRYLNKKLLLKRINYIKIDNKFADMVINIPIICVIWKLFNHYRKSKIIAKRIFVIILLWIRFGKKKCFSTDIICPKLIDIICANI